MSDETPIGKYSWAILLPSGEELHIITERFIPLSEVKNVIAAGIVTAKIYPRRDHV